MGLGAAAIAVGVGDGCAEAEGGAGDCVPTDGSVGTELQLATAMTSTAAAAAV